MRKRISRVKKTAVTGGTSPFQPSSRTPNHRLSVRGRSQRSAIQAATLDVVQRLTEEFTTTICHFRTVMRDQQTSGEARLEAQVAKCRLVQEELALWCSPRGLSADTLKAIRDGTFELYPKLGVLVEDAVKNHGATTGVRHSESYYNIFVALYDQGGVRRALNTADVLGVQISSSKLRHAARVTPSRFGLSWRSVVRAVVATLRQRDPACLLASHVIDPGRSPTAELWQLKGPVATNPLFVDRVVHLLSVVDETKLRRSLVRMKVDGTTHVPSTVLSLDRAVIHQSIIHHVCRSLATGWIHALTTVRLMC
jgi:hypothetical protein